LSAMALTVLTQPELLHHRLVVHCKDGDTANAQINS
jgi:hypothetical protein